jgi:uroporphyrinogen decarboxylase
MRGEMPDRVPACPDIFNMVPARLTGNLHITEVLLRGSVDDVVAASKKAVDGGAAGGRLILSTGDRCGRDTPDENIRAMVEAAGRYGGYQGCCGGRGAGHALQGRGA